MRHVVISFLGKDRPGIVENIANVVGKHNGNWQTSSLRHLSGFFGGIIEIFVDEEHAEALAKDIQSIDGINVSVEVSHPESFQDKTITLNVTANDRQGIIGEISAVIHKQGGNLVKLVSSQGSAPHFGQPIFKASLKIAITGQEHIDALVDALEGIADDLIVDVIV